METVTSIPSPITASKSLSIGNFKWKHKYFFYIGAAAVASYGAMYFINQVFLLKKTCFKPAGFVPNDLTLSNANINIKLQMKNKSDVDYYLKSQIYNMYINDQFVGVINNPNKLYIAPMKTTDVWLNVIFNPTQVANVSWSSLIGLITGGGDVKIQIKGKAKISGTSGLWVYNYPVDEIFTLKDLTSGMADPC